MDNKHQKNLIQNRLTKEPLRKPFLDGCKTSPSEQGLSELRQLLSSFLKEVAARAAPILNRLAREKPTSTFAEKKELAKWINAQASDLGLAVRCPKTGKPAFFIGNGCPNPETGRFQLVLREDHSRRTISAVQLPEFELVPREEFLFSERSCRGKCEGSKKGDISR